MEKSEFFTLGPVVLAFPSMFSKSAPRGTTAEPKYNTGVVITPEQYRDIVYPRLEELAGRAFRGGETSNPKFNWPFTECRFKADTYPVAAERGMLHGNLKSQFEVQVVDANRQPILDPGVVKDGAIAYISMNLYSFNKGGGIGVAAGLGPVMIVGQGEVLNVGGGGVSVEDAFAGITVDANVAPQPTTVAAPGTPMVAPETAPVTPAAPTTQASPAGIPPAPPIPR